MDIIKKGILLFVICVAVYFIPKIGDVKVLQSTGKGHAIQN